MWKEKRFSHHHILPRSQTWQSVDDNIILLPETIHRGIHTLFANKVIAEQLIKTLDLSAKAMRPEVTQRLLEVLNEHDAYDLNFWYKDNVHI